ncbi:MAG: NfeD family protein [Bacteroidia bacterium]|nr:NfeD family protein [Bacteroidia bacterium]
MNLIKSLMKGLFNRPDDEPPDENTFSKKYLSVIGKTGKTLTNLGLTGLVEIDGKEFEAESKSGFLKNDIPVRIVGKHMSWLLVEAI